MGISQMIRATKNKFRDHQTGKTKERLMQQNIELEKERNRQAELIKVNEERQRLEQDIGSMRMTNEKGIPQKSNLRKMGEGLAKVMNAGKEKVQEAKRDGHLQGIDLGVGGNRPGNIFGGSNTKQKGLQIGGSSPFNTGSAKPKKLQLMKKETKYYKQ